MQQEDNSGNDSGPDRRVQSYELGVFLFLVVPSMLISAFARRGSVGFFAVVSAAIFQDLALVSLIFFFVWRNGEPKSRLGLTARDLRKEVLIGTGLFVIIFFVINAIQQALINAGFPGETKQIPFMPHGPAQLAIALILVIVVAFSEETIFRGYLMLRFKSVTGSRSAAILLSAAVFSLGHFYEGFAGVTSVFILGIILAVIYDWRKSLIAPMVIHFLQDFIGIFVVSLTKSG